MTSIDKSSIYDKEYLNNEENVISNSYRKNFRSTLSPNKAKYKKYNPKKALHQKVVAERSFSAKFQSYRGEDLDWVEIIPRLVASVIPEILPWVIFFSVYAFVISFLSQLQMLNALVEKNEFLRTFVLSLNIILSLLLAFRTNTAHERFWEGRKLWGAMVNTVRNLARGIWLVIEEHDSIDRKEKEAALRLVAAFPVAMKLHLRREPVDSELAPLMSKARYQKLQQVNHAPLVISFWVGEYLQHQYERQRVNVYQVTPLHQALDKMVDILGGCERILKTPVPLIYTITFKTLLVVYLLVLPLILVKGLFWWTAPVVAFVCFLFLSINEVGSKIEEPFGHDTNDLPLDLICDTMVRNVEDVIQLEPNEQRYSTWRRIA